LNPQLSVTIELGPRVFASAELLLELERSLRTHLLRVNGEFGAYVPLERQGLLVQLKEHADLEYFPAGVKHRYTRQ
jgi:phenylacetate-CoA ligase